LTLQIKNKKLTISGTKAYLNVYYLPRTGGTISGSISVQENVTVTSGLTVSGATSLNTLAVSGGVTFTSLTVQNNLTVSGNISGNTITGNSANFSTVTGLSGVFASQLSGATITGNTINATSGIFQQVNTVNAVVNTNLNIGNILAVTGVATFQSNVRVTGTLSGTTVTGTSANFTSITGSGIVGTTQISGAVVTGDIGRIHPTNWNFRSVHLPVVWGSHHR
jgi:cytoskeletal protein CcmA (bactofilin family)